MYIGEFARLAGTTPKAVRLYEQIGLLPEPRRRGKYRVYRAEDLEWVGFIREAQRLGCKLGELVPLLADVTSLDHFPWQKVEQLIADKLAQIEAEVARLQRQHRGLSQCATLLAQHPAAMAPRRGNPQTGGIIPPPRIGVKRWLDSVPWDKGVMGAHFKEPYHDPNLLVLNGNPKPDSLCHALAREYARSAEQGARASPCITWGARLRAGSSPCL